MKRAIPWILLILLGILLGSISWFTNWLDDDANAFMKGFVNHELLAVLGFVVAVTLASAANINIELNRIEDQIGQRFPRTRAALKRSSTSLIWGFVFAFILVFSKPLLPAEPKWLNAAANAIAILIIFFNVMILADLTRTSFSIPSVEKIRKARRDVEPT